MWISIVRSSVRKQYMLDDWRHPSLVDCSIYPFIIGFVSLFPSISLIHYHWPPLTTVNNVFWSAIISRYNMCLLLIKQYYPALAHLFIQTHGSCWVAWSGARVELHTCRWLRLCQASEAMLPPGVRCKERVDGKMVIRTHAHAHTGCGSRTWAVFVGHLDVVRWISGSHKHHSIIFISMCTWTHCQYPMKTFLSNCRCIPFLQVLAHLLPLYIARSQPAPEWSG